MIHDMTQTTALARNAAAELRAHIARLDLPVRAVAERIGVEPSWLYRRLAGHSPITLDDLEHICSALDIDVSEILVARALVAPPVGLEPTTDRLGGLKR